MLQKFDSIPDHVKESWKDISLFQDISFFTANTYIVASMSVAEVASMALLWSSGRTIYHRNSQFSEVPILNIFQVA